ncbi:MAG: TIGR04282 family arsenosugar biosynthesis glycosyltransferase [Rhodospirillales bacterium]|nr:TIGR04282 family arsenosugar biosynthesis glycosyltransferase [Rhodospirillales bacterium]
MHSLFPARRCAIAVMAKAPVAGRAKTRLAPLLGEEGAAALGAAFLRDVTDSLAEAARHAPIDRFVAYAPAGQEGLFDGLLAPGTRLLLADGAIAAPPGIAGFGCVLLHALQALFGQGYAGVALVSADSPTLPSRFYAEAARVLLDPQGADAVLGPAEDGGYYLLGLRTPHPHPFRAITWSSASVAATTRTRLEEAGLSLHSLPPWYDVDDPASLARLQAGLGMPEPAAWPAPATARALAALPACTLAAPSRPCRA